MPQETSTLTEQPGPAAGQAVDRKGSRDGGKHRTQRQLNGCGEKGREGNKDGEKRERDGQGDRVMEEQMNRDLITRPLCPESVG